MELEAEDFFEMLELAQNRQERKQEELLLHMWGYQLPLMEKPIQFYEYLKIAKGKIEGNGDESKKENVAKQLSDDELIAMVEKMKEIDLNKQSNGGGE